MFASFVVIESIDCGFVLVLGWSLAGREGCDGDAGLTLLVSVNG
mgnify:CR=1 FL=1